MQAIVTKFLGPTNHKGARVKASCAAGSLTVSWDDALDVDGNHDKAAMALVAKLGWDAAPCGPWVGGGRPDGKGNVYVNARPSLGRYVRVKV